MKNTIKFAIIAALSFASSAAMAGYTGEQVWNASITNTQQTCGIDFANNASQTGGILVSNEQGSDNSKAIDFLLKANTANVTWAITEAHLTSNTGRFAFADDLTTVNDKSQTSVYVNNQEYSWTDATQPHTIAGNTKQINIAPKINMDQTSMPLGTSVIQGKLKVTCSN